MSQLSRSVPFTQRIWALDDGSGLVSVSAVMDIIAEAERICPEDYGFEEWINVLQKRDGHFAHGYLQALVSLLLQTMTPIGPMRDRKDYPPELQDAINYLHGRVTPASESRSTNAAPQDSGRVGASQSHDPAVAAPASSVLTREEAAEAAKAIRNGMNPATPAMFFPQGWNVILDKLDAIALGAPASAKLPCICPTCGDTIVRSSTTGRECEVNMPQSDIRRRIKE